MHELSIAEAVIEQITARLAGHADRGRASRDRRAVRSRTVDAIGSASISLPRARRSPARRWR